MSNFKTYKECYETIENVNFAISGGQGTTFKVRKKSSSHDSPTYIIKTLNQQNDLERRARMRREFTSLETIKINGIPAQIDSNTEFYENLEYKLFIVMEYIPGITLSEFVTEFRTPNLSFSEVAVFFNKLLDIMKGCHERSILHRDLKPDNIVLREDNIANPFLVDFGQSFNEIELGLETPTLQIIGNRFLFLPELSKNSSNKRDPRSDITMAVAILFYILTAKEPGHLIDESLLLPHQRVLYSKFHFPVDPIIKRYLERIFDKGFQQNINLRYQSLDALKNEFENAINPPVRNVDLKNRLAKFNEEWQSESKKILLEKAATLNNLFLYLNELSLRLVRSHFQNNLKRIAGKSISKIQESIGGTTFTFQDKIDNAKMVSFKIVGQVIGNEIIFIGDVINYALDDNIILADGELISRININQNFQVAEHSIENYIIEKTIEKI